ncbi:MAG: RNA polymerase sigma factor [Paramuribaculum sp.]|nr:RNA polymerase sigma factor [Paramuribaculum sp.]
MLSKIEELKLIARVVAFDDHRAYSRLVDEFSPALRRFVFNLTLGDAWTTDDICQNTFIKAYTSIRSFKGISRFSTWLFTIAVHEFADFRRRNRELSEIENAPEQAHDSPSHSATELRHDIHIAMQSLNDHERAAILLFYLEDRPLKEVARITGRPEGTVKATLSRAKTKMAKIIKDYHE